MAKKYNKIKRTPTFLAQYSDLRSYLKRASPLAYAALSKGMTTILDVIDDTPQGWPLRRKSLNGSECEFHLAIVNIAYRRLHVRYIIDKAGISYLVAAWVDGHDEPIYVLDW